MVKKLVDYNNRKHHHTTVLLNEAVDLLLHKSDGIYVDGTFGRGGHSNKILENLENNAKLIAIDKDLEAIKSAQSITDTRFNIINDSFKNLPNILFQAKINGGVDGVLLDLGVSSPQIDDAARGFSFMRNGILDMRMDKSKGQPLHEALLHLKEQELADIIFNYGEEKNARKIARHIKNYQNANEIKDTLTLANIIADVVYKKSSQHPATKTFQALRIYINQELSDLEQFLSIVPSILNPHGRLVIISFHSLEDRIVKQTFKNWANPNIIDSGLPRKIQILQSSLQQKKALFNILKKIKPSSEEITQNPRSRSAIMRVAIKL